MFTIYSSDKFYMGLISAFAANKKLLLVIAILVVHDLTFL